MGPNEPCVICPDTKYNHTDLGAKRSSRALFAFGDKNDFCSLVFPVCAVTYSLVTAASRNARSRLEAPGCLQYLKIKSQNGENGVRAWL
jgi:hypothetical protein